MHLLRFLTTLKLHQKATKYKWYKNWHDNKYSHYVHVATAVITSFLIIASTILNLFPQTNTAFASAGTWGPQTTFNGTSDGTYTNTTPANGNADLGLSISSPALSNNGGDSWDYYRPITVTNSSGGVLTDYQLQVNPFTDANFVNNANLVGSWHLNEGTGATTSDLSGIGNFGTINGTSYWTSSGKFSSAFSGTGDDYVDVTNESNFDFERTTPFTLEAWIKTSSSQTNNPIISKGNLWNPGWDFQIVSGKPTIYMSDGSTWIGKQPTATVNDNSWHHLMVTYDGSSSVNGITIYIDGSDSNATSLNAASLGSSMLNNNNVYIGRTVGWSSNFIGQIDEAKAYSRTLAGTEAANKFGVAGVPKVRSDYQDIRFTKTDGTELPYWQETDGKYWVKYSGSLGTGNTDIKMYYSNPNATFTTPAQCASAPVPGTAGYANCGDNTFQFFDDFESGNLNKWTLGSTPTAVTTQKISGNYSVYFDHGTADESITKVHGVTGTTVLDYWTRADQTNDFLYSYIGLGNNPSANLYMDSSGNFSYYDGSSHTITTYAANTWYKIKLVLKNSSNYDIYIYNADGTLRGSAINTPYRVDYPLNDLRITSDNGRGYIDTVRIRQYATGDNTVTAGNPGAEAVTGYASSGTYVTNAIAPTGLYGNWGNLTYNVTAGGQTITIDVLDSGNNPVTGCGGTCQNVASGTNINASTTTYPSLKLRANLSTADPAQTPLLNDWTVGYNYDVVQVPAALTITPTSATASLSWSVSSLATLAYQVQRAPDSGGNPGTWVAAGGTCAGTVSSTSCDDSGLSANTKYFWRVKSVDVNSNSSGWSGEQNVDTNVKGLWHLNEGSGGTTTEATGNITTTTMNGSSWTSSGKFGPAFNGTGNSAVYVSATSGFTNTIKNNNTHTIEMWVYATSIANAPVLLDAPGLGAAGAFLEVGDGAPNTYYWGYAGSYRTYTGTALSTGTWHYVAAVKTGAGDLGDLYVDGVKQTSYTGTLGSTPNSNSDFYFGRYQSAGFELNGQIDEVRISNTARSGADILAYYNESSPNPKSATTLANPPVLDSPASVTNDTRPQITNSSNPDTSFANNTVNLYDGAIKVAATRANGSGVFTFGDNKALNHSFETDSNSDGIADNWAINSNDATVGGITRPSVGIDGTYAQRILLAVPDAKSGKSYGIMGDMTPVGSYAAGESAAGSAYLKGFVAGCNAKIYIYAYDSGGTHIANTNTTVTLTSSWQKFTHVYSSLPANTSRVRFSVILTDIDTGDTGDVFADNTKLDNYNQNLSEGLHASITAKSTNSEGIESGASNTVSTTVDTIKPVITSFSVNSGAQFTGSTDVDLALAATDTGGSGVYQMQFSNDGQNWSAWESYGTSKDWTLASGDGTKIVYLQVKDNAGNITKYTTTPSGAAVSDWQAMTQGNHYGNFYDSVTGTWASVTRAGAKTIYDPLTKRIYDVPANYLGVNPRGDGKGGSEAVIEESRINNLLNSYFNADSNGDGTPDSWSWASNTSGAPTYSLVQSPVYGKSAKVNYTSVSDNTKAINISQATASGTFAPGDNVTGSVFFSGPQPGLLWRLFISARNDAMTNLGEVAVSLTSAGRFSVTYSNLPAGTTRVYYKLAVENIDTGDLVDAYFSALQIEKGSFATSYIPTTTASVTRNADNVTIPTTSWSATGGSIFFVATPPPDSQTHRLLTWINTTDNRISPACGSAIFANQVTSGGTPQTASVPIHTSYDTLATTWSTGNKVTAYKNGVRGTDSTGNAVTPIGLPATAYLGSWNGLSTSYGTPIHRVVIYSSQLSDSDVTTVTNAIKDSQGSINLDTTAPVASSDAVISPNGSEAWRGGSSQTIRWNPGLIYDDGSGLAATPIKLQYTVNGSDFTDIALSEANDGSYTWNPLPSIDTSTAKIKITVSDGVNLTAADQSDANFTIDSTGPTGTITINEGDYTSFTTINLTLSASDSGSGLYQMQFSDDGIVWGSWETFGISKVYTLSGIDGLKEVYVHFSDNAGNTGPDYHDDITYDNTPPTNPTGTVGRSTAGAPVPDLTSSNWYNYLNPRFDWSGATDTTAGVKGYWVYFGTDSGAEPKTATDSGNLAYVDNGNNNFYTGTQYVVSSTITDGTYYLKIRTQDNALNDADASYTENQNEFIYKFDNANPNPVSYVTPDPAGWSTSDPYSFSWPAASDGSGSGVAGYEYKRDNGTDSWTFTASLSVSGINHYQNGVNIFKVRVKDNVGNYSSEVNTNYYFTGSIAAPTNLAVDLSQSQGQTVNSFKFTWDPPGGVTVGAYHYSVNAAPTVSNTTRTTDDYTPFYSAATQQGLNTFYVVTEDSAGNVGWLDYSTVNFTVNTVAPDVPLGMRITDASDRGTSNWALTVGWTALTDQPPDFVGYSVFKCTSNCDNNANYSKAADVTTNIYSEAGLSNTTDYYFKIKSRDNTNHLSDFSAAVHRIPTGKYTTPPAFTSGPTDSPKALSVNISWTTNRPSNTIVQYGTTASYGQEASKSTEAVTDHSIEILGLTPGTKYHYRIQSLDADRDYDPNLAFSGDYTFTTLAAPGISDVSVSEIRLTSAIITWKTTSSATSTVHYGTTTAYGKTYNDQSGSQTTTHTVKLTSLSDSTNYHFKITGTDVDGNALQSDDYVFNTLTFPKLSNLKIEQIPNTPSSTVKVKFDSNVPTSSLVTLSGKGGKETAKYDLETSHEVKVGGLQDNTEYTVTVKGRDQYGNETVSISSSYKTDFDTRPPLISDITVETSIIGYGLDAKGQIVVSWTTDEPASSQIEYGSGVTGDYSSKTSEDSSLTENHVVIISDLKPSSPYHFRIISKDNSGNTGISADNSVLTEQASESIIDLIIKSLQSSIGWIFNIFVRK